MNQPEKESEKFGADRPGPLRGRNGEKPTIFYNVGQVGSFVGTGAQLMGNNFNQLDL